jgi:uncharacterized membrane protein YfcA
MPELSDFWLNFVILGLVAGFCSGMLGIGSSIIIVPALTLLFLKFGQKDAQGMCLAVMVPMALVSAIRYKMNPGVKMDFLPISLLALGAIVGAFAGATLVQKSFISNETLRKIFGVFVLFVGILMLATSPKKKEELKKDIPAQEIPEIK